MHTGNTYIIGKVNKMFQKRFSALAAVAAFACFLASAQQLGAQTIDHVGGFSSHDDLTANTNDDKGTPPRMVFAEDLLELTAGTNGNKTSVFANTQVDASNFYTAFYFQINPPQIADGFAFVIQNDVRGVNAIGPGGGGLAYGADRPMEEVDPNAIVRSIAIKFDIFQGNPCETLGPSTTGLFVDGHSPTCPTTGTEEAYFDTRPSGIDLRASPPPLFLAEFVYDGTTLYQWITNTNTGMQFTQTYTVNIPAHLGGNTGLVGFTGATGGLSFRGDIVSWIWQSPAPF